jgi:hypothetical protein
MFIIIIIIYWKIEEFLFEKTFLKFFAEFLEIFFF